MVLEKDSKFAYRNEELLNFYEVGGSPGIG